MSARAPSSTSTTQLLGIDRLLRAAYTAHAEDDDFVQPRTLVNEVMDDDARARLVSNIVGPSRGCGLAATRDRRRR